MATAATCPSASFQPNDGIPGPVGFPAVETVGRPSSVSTDKLVGSAACGGSEGAGRAGVSRFVRDDRTGPAKADDHDIPAWQLSGHRKAWRSLRGGLPIGRAHYADGAERELLVVAPDAIAVVVARAWEADHLPGAHVAVSAVE